MLFIEVYIYNGLNKKCIKKKKVRIIRKNNKIQRRGFFMKKENKDKGITLVALVITIIILLILATISIQSLTNTGLFAKAQEAKEKSQNAEENQAKTLNEYEDELNKYISGDVKTPVKKLVII